MEQVHELSQTEIDRVSGAAIPPFIVVIVDYFVMKALDELIEGGESLPQKVVKNLKQRIEQR